MRRTLLLVPVLALSGCGGGGFDEPGMPESITVTSTAFSDGARVPAQFTCAGEGTSPPLSWSGVPDDARSLVLEVQDPDAPGNTFVHWLVVNLPPDDATIAAGESPPGTARENSSGKAGWAPPCPPSGMHHYHFTVYALDVGVVSDPDVDGVSELVEEHLVAWGDLVGTVAAKPSGGGGY
jgi:Raf kinase inhibitor-like YbhB/YbcL family protein